MSRAGRWLTVLVVLATMPAVAVPRECPPPEGAWRLHRLARCAGAELPTGEIGDSLGLAARLFAQGSGGDAVAELEACVRERGGEQAPGLSEVQLVLGQLYLLAALGGGVVVPREGPAPKSGNPSRDRATWLDRAQGLLTAAAGQRPDDGVVDYLLAEVARARGDLETAAATELRGMRKCSCEESLEVVRHYQRVRNYAAQVTSPIQPAYPEAARRQKRQGVVRLDLLIDPEARVAQVEIVDGDPDLAAAAAEAARFAGYQAARVGLYPVWAWLRVAVEFRMRPSG